MTSHNPRPLEAPTYWGPSRDELLQACLEADLLPHDQGSWQFLETSELQARLREHDSPY